MAAYRRIVANEAHRYAADRLSPGIGAIRLFREPSPIMRAFTWMRWWHWAGLALTVLLLVDQRL
jgi:hypothetical protein